MYVVGDKQTCDNIFCVRWIAGSLVGRSGCFGLLNGWIMVWYGLWYGSELVLFWRGPRLWYDFVLDYGMDYGIFILAGD